MGQTLSLEVGSFALVKAMLAQHSFHNTDLAKALGFERSRYCRLHL